MHERFDSRSKPANRYPGRTLRAFQIANGLGAGNIGDELMARAFWDQMPESVALDVAVFGESARQHAEYPRCHRYVLVDPAGNENGYVEDMPGWLVADTPVTEAEGLQWPLRFLSVRLRHFHERSLPVDAVAVGVDRLHSVEARDIFQRDFLPIRSWTVRSPQCRDALLELGVAAEQILVGADLAWLYQPRRDLRDWAAGVWTSLGVDPRRPLLVMNPVNILWRHHTASKQAVATALDRLEREGYQIAFFCNEARIGDFYDWAAIGQIRARMQRPSAAVPNEYFSPDEALALLSHATVAAGQRYHFCVQAVLAGSLPVAIKRGQKMESLVGRMNLYDAGSIDEVTAESLVDAVDRAWAHRHEYRERLAAGRLQLAAEALENNCAFLDRYFFQTPDTGVEAASAPLQVASARGRKSYWICHTGGLGDLVLSASLVASIKRESPQSHVTVACRPQFRSLPKLFPHPPDVVLPLAFDPYQWAEPGPRLYEALSEQVRALQGARPDVFVSAEYHPTWFGWFLASLLQAGTSLCVTTSARPVGLLDAMLEAFALTGPEMRRVDPGPDCNEEERYGRLLRELGHGTHVARPWELLPECRESARVWLQERGLGTGQYLLCFPFGSSGTKVKRWPIERFTDTIERAWRQAPFPVVLTGESGERADLEQAAKQLSCRGVTVAVFAGTPDDLPLLTGLVAGARAYFGNDTGPMHLGTVFNVPGVSIHGGGCWPNYAPLGRGAVAMVHPLACFQCSWDCLFARGVCVESIHSDDVLPELLKTLANPDPVARSVKLHHTGATIDKLIEDANRTYRAAQKDRAARLNSIVELHHVNARRAEQLQTVERDRESLRAQADAREQGLADLAGQIQQRDRRIRELESHLERLAQAGGPDDGLDGSRQQIAEQDQRIRMLEEAAEERLRKIIELDARLRLIQQHADLRESAIQSLTADLAACQEQNSDLERAAHERLVLLERADIELRLLRQQAEQRAADVESLTRWIAERDRRIEELSAAADQRLAALQAADAELAAIRQQAEQRAADVESLTRWIAERDRRIEELSAAADQRLAALQSADAELVALRAEADRRAAAIEELVRTAAAQDERIGELEQAAEERLMALTATSRHLEAIHAEASRRARDIDELTLIVQQREKDLREAQQSADDRLRALEALEADRKAVGREAASRLEQIHALHELLAQREQRIALLDATATERLAALEATDAALRSALEERDAFALAARERLSLLEETASRYQVAASDLRQSLARIAELEAALNHWKTALDAARRRSEELERANVVLRRDQAILNQELLAFRSENLLTSTVRHLLHLVRR